MTIFKWELLKNKAKSHVDAMSHDSNTWTYAVLSTLGDLAQGKYANWKDNLKEMQDLARTTIDNWDIRMCQDLIKAFPSIIPKIYLNRVPIVEMDEKGDWILIYEVT